MQGTPAGQQALPQIRLDGQQTPPRQLSPAPQQASPQTWAAEQHRPPRQGSPAAQQRPPQKTPAAHWQMPLLQGSAAGQEPQVPPQPSSPHILPWQVGSQAGFFPFFFFFLGFFFFFFFASAGKSVVKVMPNAPKADMVKCPIPRRDKRCARAWVSRSNWDASMARILPEGQ